MEQFLKKMPKIELHAHLNGSLCSASMRELAESLYSTERKEEFERIMKRFASFHEFEMDACFEKFAIMHELTATRRGLHLATRLVVRDFARDNVVYLELRTTPKTTAYMTKLEYLRCVLDAVDEAQLAHEGAIQVRLLPSFDRSKSLEDAAETLELIQLLREEAASKASLLVGLDFSGHPSKGIFHEFKPLLERARLMGLPLAMHCAEVDGNAAEVEDMLNFGMSRCGHGTFLSEKSQLQLQRVNVPVECCLTSNIKCGTVMKYDEHHIKQLKNASNLVVLCTDDCGVFDTTLTQEFHLAVQTFSLTLEDVERLCIDAVQYSFAEKAIKDLLCCRVQNYFKDNKI